MWTRANHKESQGIHHPRRESDGSVFRHRHQVIPISLFIPLNVISSDFWPSFWLFLISMRSSRRNRKLTSFNKWNFRRNHKIVYKFDMHVLHTNVNCSRAQSHSNGYINCRLVLHYLMRIGVHHHFVCLLEDFDASFCLLFKSSSLMFCAQNFICEENVMEGQIMPNFHLFL